MSTLNNILLVEDDVIVADVLRRMLVRSAYTVRMARDGMEALAELAHRPPSVLILDLFLPVISGFHVLEEMQRRNITVPTIIITANPLYDDPLRYAGIISILIKPFSFHDLLAALRAIVGIAPSPLG